MFKSGLRIARIFGIDILVDASWIFIFLLLVWNLAGGVFPEMHPDWSTSLTWGTSIVAALLFFASVLAHELSHSIVARARGLPVSRIVLFLFGGVSNIEHEPTSPKTEFIMALVGPLTSLVLGGIFLLVGVLVLGGNLGGDPLQALSAAGPLPTLLLWLGPINILLGIFNLIPGFPLDGGRIVRSILWALTKDLKRSTQWASWVGQGIAWLLILAGISMVFGLSIPFFGTGLIAGLWTAFIGWFLNNAAIQSYQQVVLEDLLQGVPVSRLMQATVPTVSPNVTVQSLVNDFIMGTNERDFPVVDGDKLLGLVCVEDVRKIPHDRWDTSTVRDIMTPGSKLTVASPREPATEALNELATHEINQVPVLQEGHLVGMLRRRDILKWLQLHSEFSAH